ncbi:MAG: UDP-N-acetylmuramoyl-L-alanine--D-glutamate ligase [Candidatus Poribacteria bacterium]|nr:UDP-N-acetylmuramoyl-L-alanine--D-glutamate ligase [Candidatus Poribacteria bacterium]
MTTLNLRERLNGTTVAVIGLGRSGLAAGMVLAERGANVVLNDSRNNAQLGAVREAAEFPVLGWVTGGHPVELAEKVDLIVVSPGVPYDLPMLVAARDRNIPTIGELELAYQLTNAPFVAITGTKGKTTTTTLVGRVLDGNVSGTVRVAGNIGIPLTMEAPRLTEHDTLVAEVSSFQLESIVDFRPRIGVMLNLSADHLDRHVTMEAYLAAKRRLTENQTADDLLILNDDDEASRSFAEITKAKIRRFSLERPVGEGAFIRDAAFVWRDGSRETVVGSADDLRVPGRHFTANALAALSAALSMGVSPDAAMATLRDFEGLPHTYETVRVLNGVRYVNDTKATNVAAVTAALNATSERVVLIMGGVDKGNEYDELVSLVGEKARHLTLLGPNVARLEAAFQGIVPTSRAASMREAVQLSAKIAQSGDCVLMSPGHASFDLFTDWKERGNAFREAVNELS